jgi:hypothetical protein
MTGRNLGPLRQDCLAKGSRTTSAARQRCRPG